MIEAKIIADSITEEGKRLTTFELEYPRYIHSEYMTHRVFSRNAASSRAIPFKSMLKLIWNNPAKPIHWGENKPGMSADKELCGFKRFFAEVMWNLTGKVVCGLAYLMSFSKVHKQIINRMMEPWSHIKVISSATEWDNFFNLRCHKDAQPEIQELACKMRDALEASIPKLKKDWEWHLPYMDDFNIVEIPFNTNDITLEDAIKVSVSLCAQVSYRKQDFSLKKANDIYDKLLHGEVFHASPFEHVAKPAKKSKKSGNFIGWEQYRHIIKK